MPWTPADQSIPAPAVCRGSGVSPPLDRRGAKRRLDRNYGNQEARMPPAAWSLAVAAAVGAAPTALLALTFSAAARTCAPCAIHHPGATRHPQPRGTSRCVGGRRSQSSLGKSKRDAQVAQRVLVRRLKYALVAGYVPKKFIKRKVILRIGPLSLELGGKVTKQASTLPSIFAILARMPKRRRRNMSSRCLMRLFMLSFFTCVPSL